MCVINKCLKIGFVMSIFFEIICAIFALSLIVFSVAINSSVLLVFVHDINKVIIIANFMVFFIMFNVPLLTFFLERE